MQLNSIAAEFGGYVDSLLNDSGGIASSSTNSSGGFSASSQSADSSQLSPLAQIFNTLQQLQESHLMQYQKVTQKIAKNLQAAAKTALSDGNTDAVGQLSQLATDFSQASATGELPDIHDLANTIGVAHYQAPAETGADDRWSFVSPSPPNVTTNPELNPLSIMLNTLSSSGMVAHA